MSTATPLPLLTLPAPPQGNLSPNVPNLSPGGLTLGGLAGALVAHSLQGGEGHVETAVGTRPEGPQALAVEVGVRLGGGTRT